MPSVNPFLAQHADDVLGILNGFDRVRLRGTLRSLAHIRGMQRFLDAVHVPLTEFASYVDGVTTEVKRAAEAIAATAGRPVIYLQRSSVNKEQQAREIARRDTIDLGLICTLKAVEGCWSYELHRDRARRHVTLVPAYRKCLHYYHYLVHPEFGFLHLRLQSWFPFTVHVCLNGREWLARQMDAAGLAYRRRENCFVWLADIGATQRLADRQVTTRWDRVLDGLVRALHPAHATLFAGSPVRYYWSMEQSEWASDVLFRGPGALAALYPQLLAHAMQHLGSRDVMRYLGKRLPPEGLPRTFGGEVVTDLTARREGVRIKHRVNSNWLKMYDKQGSVLRVETVINDARAIRAYRATESDPRGPKQWRKMRKSVADVPRRAEVSQQANDRYLASLAAVEAHESLASISRKVCQRTRWRERSVRALNPLAPADGALLAAIYRGEFLLHGFRNRDLSVLKTAASPAAVTSQLRLLRAHDLIKKLPQTHRYHLTTKGRTIVAALLAARQADTTTLTKAA
jgi:hypothetical protein